MKCSKLSINKYSINFVISQKFPKFNNLNYYTKLIPFTFPEPK